MKTTILVAGGALLLAACSGSGAVNELANELPDVTPTTAAPTTEAPTPVTDDEIDLIALDAVWADQRSTICSAYHEAIGTGIDPDVIADLAVRSFAEGSGEPVSAAVQARLIELIDEC